MYSNNIAYIYIRIKISFNSNIYHKILNNYFPKYTTNPYSGKQLHIDHQDLFINSFPNH